MVLDPRVQQPIRLQKNAGSLFDKRALNRKLSAGGDKSSSPNREYSDPGRGGGLLRGCECECECPDKKINN